MTDLVTRWESEKLTRDLDYLMTCLADMFHGVGEEKLAESLPWKSEGTVVIDDFRVVRAWSIAFQLRNMAEENLAVQRRRALETENEFAAAPGLWGEVLEQLKGLGLTEEKVAAPDGARQRRLLGGTPLQAIGNGERHSCGAANHRLNSFPPHGLPCPPRSRWAPPFFIPAGHTKVDATAYWIHLISDADFS